MSADNWTTCPRCLKEAYDEVERQRAAVLASYGKVPVEEFDERRHAIAEVAPGEFETFREDYEFYGAEEGEVQASYKGRCTKCGLGVEIKESRKFWP